MTGRSEAWNPIPVLPEERPIRLVVKETLRKLQDKADYRWPRWTLTPIGNSSKSTTTKCR
jgi:hypothetical protein